MRQEHGFTLIELVVGMLLTVLLLWLLSGAFAIGGKAINASLMRYNAAHAAFMLDSYLDADLQGANPGDVNIGSGGHSLTATWYSYDPATVTQVTYQANYYEDSTGHLQRQLTLSMSGSTQTEVSTLAWNVVPNGVDFSWGNSQHTLLDMQLTTGQAGIQTGQEIQIPLLVQAKGGPWP